MQSKLWHFFVAASAYFLAGRIGLTLAIPPGFASAVWPAAGIALACLLVMQSPASLAGIGAGSFLINLGLASNQYTEINASSLLPSLCIACGAMAQAMLGYGLFKRSIGLEQTLDNPRHILRFVLLVCLMGDLIGCSVGCGTLYFSGIIPAEAVPFTWLTWWVGDSIGVLLFTPLLLSFFHTQDKFSTLRKLQISLPTLIIFSVTWWIFLISMEKTHQEKNFNAEKITTEFAEKIRGHLHIAEHKLTAYLAFFAADSDISQAEFNAFSSIIVHHDDAIFQGIGWTRIIPHHTRAAVEAEYQQRGFTDFHFTEFGPDGSLKIAEIREEYYPVLYIYPLESNLRAFGLNLAANPQRKAALLHARQSKQAVATAPITLAQETEQQKATILYVPVFMALNTPEETFLGYVSGVLRINGILGDLIALSQKQGISLNITDITDPEKPAVLYSDGAQLQSGFDVKNYYAEFGTRQYDIRIYPSTEYSQDNRDWTSWLIITGGFLIAALLQVFMLILTGTYEHVRQEVARKTLDLQAAIANANAANKAKSDFLANMSHELRTPLNSIIGFLHLCLKTPLSAQQEGYLHKADLSSSTLLALINQSLDYAKIEAGKIELEHQEVSISLLLEKIHAIFMGRAQEKNLHFAISLQNEIPTLVNGDALRIEQILLNLLSNAFKFTEQGAVHLSVQYQADTETLNFAITDTGIGITPDNIERVFEAFRQADTSTSRRFGGTGLGLSISKQLAKLMGGDIKLHSQPGQGSTFQVSLPLTRAGEKNLSDVQLQNILQHAPAEKNTPATPDQPYPLTGKCILLAEDIEMNQILAQSLLEEWGASVVLADNGKKALEMLAQHPATDLILMDIQMPEMDGYAATQKIRENPAWQHIPILAMTANAMQDDIQQCIAIGMQGHIAKPIDEQKMLASILQHLPPQ